MLLWVSTLFKRQKNPLSSNPKKKRGTEKDPNGID